MLQAVSSELEAESSESKENEWEGRRSSASEENEDRQPWVSPGTTLNSHPVTSPLLSISQSVRSLLKTEAGDFIATTALTVGVILVDLCHHFTKTTVQYTSALRNGVFQRTLIFSKLVFSGMKESNNGVFDWTYLGNELWLPSKGKMLTT